MLSSRESPRSGVNVVGLRPSLIAQHSLRSPSCALFTSARREGGFLVINDGRSPGKTPSIRGDSRERKSRATKNTKMHEKLFWRGIPYCGFSCPFVAITPPRKNSGHRSPQISESRFPLDNVPRFCEPCLNSSRCLSRWFAAGVRMKQEEVFLVFHGFPCLFQAPEFQSARGRRSGCASGSFSGVEK